MTIDASGAVPGRDRARSTAPPSWCSKLADAPSGAQSCFASHWLQLAYGRTLGAGDECLQAAVDVAFHKAGYDVRQLLLALTQTDAFLYLPARP